MNTEPLINILKDLHPDIDFTKEDNLIGRKILDSFDIVTLVDELSRAYDIDIDADDMIPENFQNLSAMESLIQEKLDWG